MGSNRDLTLQSGLRLQFSGPIADSVIVTGAVTDEQTPIQPEGNTQTLREVDNIFIEVRSPVAGATLGKFVAGATGSEGRGISMKKYLRPEWRTQSRTKRKFYAKYLRWVEQLGYLIVTAVFAAFIYAFNTKADDVIKAEGVRIEAASTPITASEESIIVRRLVPNFSKVSKGTLVLEIHSVASSDKVQPSVRITAPADGVFVITESEKPYAKGDTIAQILNYSKLIAQAELEGATVGKAREGQPVRLSAITYSDTGIVFR